MEVFREYARRNKESVWGPFLNMLNRPDGFIVNQVSQLTFTGLTMIFGGRKFCFFVLGLCILRKCSSMHEM